MAIGNIIGSNLVNITMVIGVSAIVGDLPIDLNQHLFDISIMTASTIVFIYIMANKLYSRPAGISLLILLALFIENALNGLTPSS